MVENKELYLQTLNKEISPAMGCTEPAAVALCAAGAAALLDGPAERLEIRVSEYILKNGMNVGIPGTDCTGLYMAGALGAIRARPEEGLLVLDGLSDAQKARAVQLSENGMVSVALAEHVNKIYVEVTACSGAHTAKAVIEGGHTRFTRKEKDELVVWERAEKPERICEDESVNVGMVDYSSITIDGIWEFIHEVSASELTFLQKTVDMNTEIAREGLQNDYGLHVGRGMALSRIDDLLGKDVANRAAFTVAAAVDARMSGCQKPVMSVAGSGNQGLTATVPVIVIAREMGIPDEEMYRALALSILTTIHAKQYIGRLSVLCGCSIASAIGVCAAIIYLHRGTQSDVYAGIRTMAADISGMICDGAKPGCALKIATSVNAAARAAELALNGIGATFQDGIVERDVEETLNNLGRLGNEGMAGTNHVILNMLLQKSPACAERVWGS